MTISTTSPYAGPYAGDGSTLTLAVTFPFRDAPDLLVVITDGDGNETTLALDTDYTVTQNISDLTGSITLATAVATGSSLIIARNMPYTQTTSVRNQGTFLPHIHEDEFDNLVMMIQQLAGITGGVNGLLGRFMTKSLFGDHWKGQGIRIQDIADPIKDQDAATKHYVDAGDAKLQSEIDALQIGQESGIIGFETKDAMTADTTSPVGTLAIVTNDSDYDNNTTYRWDGTQWVPIIDRLKVALGATNGFFAGTDLALATGAVVRTFLEKGRDVISVKDFGAVGDDSSDDTIAFQSFVDYLQKSGKSGFIPSGIYKITAPITASQSFRMYGEGANPIVGDRSVRSGSWLHFSHDGIGIKIASENSGVLAKQEDGASFRNFGTMRDQTDPSSSDFIPGDFDYDFYFDTVTVDIDSVVLLNPTYGIYLHYGRLNVFRVTGQPFAVGIYINRAYDICRISDIEFWPYWSGTSSVVTYMQNKSIAIQLGRVDGPMLKNCFTWSYRNHIRVIGVDDEDPAGTYPGGTVDGGFINGSYADSCSALLFVDASSDGATMTFENCMCQGPDTPISGGKSIFLAGTFSDIKLIGCRFTLAAEQSILVDGKSNVVMITNCHVGMWDYIGSGHYGIELVDVSSTVMVSDEIYVPGVNSTSLDLYRSNAGGRFSAPLGNGRITTGTTDASGFITVGRSFRSTPNWANVTMHNGPGEGSAYPEAFTSTSITLGFQNASGTALANTVNINASWSARYEIG